MQRLAEAVHVPMGIEVLPPTAFPSHDDRPSLTGLTLRDALDVLAAIDPRYSWREMDGMIVFRPVDAWNDASSPLFRLVPGFKADDVPLSRVVGLLMARLGDEGHIRNYLPDTRPISIDLPTGNRSRRAEPHRPAHGELCWEWSLNSAADRRLFSGRRFTLMCSSFKGGGYGFAIP